MSTRARLPNRRHAETFSFEVGGLTYTCTIGCFPDGRVGEIFLSNHKSNSTADVNARDAAIACSFALQHGADIETIRKALCRDARGLASSPLGAALDAIAKENTNNPELRRLSRQRARRPPSVATASNAVS